MVEANMPQESGSNTFRYEPEVSKTTPYRETVGPAKSIEVVNFSSNTIYVAFEGLSSISDNWDMAVPAWLTRVQPYTGSGQLTTVLVGNGVARGSHDQVIVRTSGDLEGAGYFQLPQTITVKQAQAVKEVTGSVGGLAFNNHPLSMGRFTKPANLYGGGGGVFSLSSRTTGTVGNLQMWIQGASSGTVVTIGWASAPAAGEDVTLPPILFSPPLDLTAMMPNDSLIDVMVDIPDSATTATMTAAFYLYTS